MEWDEAGVTTLSREANGDLCCKPGLRLAGTAGGVGRGDWPLVLALALAVAACACAGPMDDLMAPMAQGPYVWNKFAPIASTLAGLGADACEGAEGFWAPAGAVPLAAAAFADFVAIRQRASQSAVSFAWANDMVLVCAATIAESRSASFLRK